MIRKCQDHTLQSNSWHFKEETHNTYNHMTERKESKQSNQLYYPVSKTIAKLERTTKRTKRKTPTHNESINEQCIYINRTTTLEQTAAEATGGLKAINWHQIFALHSAVVKTQRSHGGFRTCMRCTITEIQSNRYVL